MAKALVPFYPLSGRLSPNKDGRIEVNCNGEGALLVVARYDAQLNDFDNFAPSTEMRDLFAPPTDEQPDPYNSILLMVQVTVFKCGGIALGTALHHSLVDARSGFHFMETWSNIARGQASCNVPPFFDHTLLSARPDPKILFDHLEYRANPKSLVLSDTSYESSVLKISKKEIDALKLRCGDMAGAHVSTFRAITVVIWRCVCMARELDADSESRLYTMIDMRNRMCPPLPPTYFGNAVIRTSVSAMVGDVISSPINHVAQRILGATKQGDDYTRSLIDFLETADMGNLPRSGLSKSDLRIISWLGMPQHNVDFGWGKPVFCGPAKMYYRGYICLMNSPGKDAGVSIAVALEPESLSRFKLFFFEELAMLHA